MFSSLAEAGGAGLERSCGPAEWVNARGLRDSRPLAETALTAGFADQAYVTRTFRAALCMTPGRYVKLCTGRR